MNDVTISERLGNYSVVDGNGQYQSVDDNPSHIDARGTMSWHQKGVLHRVHGPAVKGENLEIWYRDGKIHRDGDEPAIYEDKGRRVMYYKEDRLHRVFGPAVITLEGVHKEEQFWINGQKYGDRVVWEPHAAPLRALESPQEPSTPVENAVEEILKKSREKKASVEVIISANETVVIPPNNDILAGREQNGDETLSGPVPEEELKVVLDASTPPLVGSEFNKPVDNVGNPPALEQVEKKERKKREKKVKPEEQ